MAADKVYADKNFSGSPPDLEKPLETEKV